MRSEVGNLDVVLMLSAFSVLMAMGVLMTRGMPVRHVRWFFLAAFALLAVVVFRESWAAGTFVVVAGGGLVAMLDGVLRRAEREKAKKESESA